MRRLFVVLLVATAMVLPSQASARRERELSYQYAQVWSAAVRLLRVDFQFPIADRDEGNGFLLFEYRDPQGRTYQASLELVPITRGGQTTVRVVSNVSSMPSYVEGVLIDRLEAKLRQDFGAPIRRTRPPAQAPSRDAETEPSDEAPSETPPTDGTTPTAG